MTDLKRPVRPEQHGTITGYVYGCRCDPCRAAQRERNRTHPGRASEEALGLVLAALEREADLDGIVTASSYRLAEISGLSNKTAWLAVDQLVAAGRVRRLGTAGGPAATPVLELVDVP